MLYQYLGNRPGSYCVKPAVCRVVLIERRGLYRKINVVQALFRFREIQ